MSLLSRLAPLVTIPALLALAIAPATTASAATTHHHGILPPKNPARNVAPDPSFGGPCSGGSETGACNRVVLKAIGHARRTLEGFGGMAFRLSAYEKMGPRQKLFVTANLERIERGLAPAAALTRSLDKVAQAGAVAHGDPDLSDVTNPLPGGGWWTKMGGNWAAGSQNPLGSDYAWMYSDAGSSWGHRDNILGSYVSPKVCSSKRRELIMGTGYVRPSKAYPDSETELFVGDCGPMPTDIVMTWNRARKLLHL